MEGGICFLIRPIVVLCYVAKYLFLVSCMRIRLTGINSVACHHLESYGLVLSTSRLWEDVPGDVGSGYALVSTFMCHMPDTPLRRPYKTSLP